MMELNHRIENGEWIAIAADRVPVRGEKTADINFLGHTAPMPQGAWLIGFAFKNTGKQRLFCVKQKRPLSFETAPLYRHFQLETRQPRGCRQRRDAAFCRHFGARMCAKSATMVQFL